MPSFSHNPDKNSHHKTLHYTQPCSRQCRLSLVSQFGLIHQFKFLTVTSTESPPMQINPSAISNVITDKSMDFRCPVSTKQHIKPVRPQLEYGSTVWSPYTQSNSNIHKTEMVQLRAICWMLCNYSTYESVTKMQSRLVWRTLEQRRESRHAPLYVIQNCSQYCTSSNTSTSVFPATHKEDTSQPPLALRQIHTSANFYKYSFFPLADTVLLPTLTQFNAAVRSSDNRMPYTQQA